MNFGRLKFWALCQIDLSADTDVEKISEVHIDTCIINNTTFFYDQYVSEYQGDGSNADVSSP